MAEKQSKLPWILLSIAIGGGVGAGILAAQQAEAAREAKVEADAAWDSAGTLLEDLEEREARFPLVVDSLNVFWQTRLDSIAVLPPEVPELDPRYQALLDTAELTREIRFAIQGLRAENGALRVQNEMLREQVVDLRVATAQAIDSVNAFWRREREQDLVVIESLRVAVEKSRAEADKWETAYYASRMSILDRVKWGLGGAVVGYLANEFTGSDVSVETCSCDSFGGEPTFQRASFKTGAN